MLRTTGLTQRYGSHAAPRSLTPALRAGPFAGVEVAGHALARSACATLRHLGVVLQPLALDVNLGTR